MPVELNDIVKTYGTGEGKQTAVDHVNFTIDEGEFVVILGQSGAGKSTILNMLCGMDTPTESMLSGIQDPHNRFSSNLIPASVFGSIYLSLDEKPPVEQLIIFIGEFLFL